MSDQEFNALIDALTLGLPLALTATRLVLLVRALVEQGGDPAADCLRAVVQLRNQPAPSDDPEFAELGAQPWIEP